MSVVLTLLLVALPMAVGFFLGWSIRDYQADVEWNREHDRTRKEHR